MFRNFFQSASAATTNENQQITTNEQSTTNLTRDELLSGRKIGVHEVTDPIQTFQSLKCVCDYEPITAKFGKENLSPVVSLNGVATTEIPTGATVVRAGGYIPDHNMRTDQVVVKDIHIFKSVGDYFSKISNCKCTGWASGNNKQYEIGKKQTSPLNTMVDKSQYTDSNEGICVFKTYKEAKEQANFTIGA